MLRSLCSRLGCAIVTVAVAQGIAALMVGMAQHPSIQEDLLTDSVLEFLATAAILIAGFVLYSE